MNETFTFKFQHKERKGKKETLFTHTIKMSIKYKSYIQYRINQDHRCLQKLNDIIIKNGAKQNVAIGLARGAHSLVDNFKNSANIVKFNFIFIFSLTDRIVLHLDAL